MSEQTDKLLHTLKLFGLTSEEASLYYLLSVNSPQTALQISKNIKMSRTKVYRILDKLIEKKLVVQKIQSRGLQFEAQSFDALQFLIKDKESELEILKNSLPTFFAQINQLKTQSKKKSKVLYYKGVEGLKQVTWNSTKAKNTLSVFEMGNDMSSFLKPEFSEKVRKGFVKNGLKIARQLTNKKKINPYTKIKEFSQKIQKYAFIDPKDFKIEIEMLIYDDVVAVYQYRDQEIFCIEIVNAEFANMQLKLFDYMWKNSQKMKIDKNGGASI